MPRKSSTPNTRASDATKRVDSVRRKYKVDTKSKKRLLDAEIPYVKDMVVLLKVAGYSRTQIAQVVGISRGQVAGFLEDPEVEKKLLDLRERLPAAAKELMQGYMIEAVQAVVDVMRSTDDDQVRLKAAADVLDRGGMPKASRQEKTVEETQNHNVSFDTDFMELIRQAPPEIQEQAASMIEGLEALLKTKAEEADELAD